MILISGCCGSRGGSGDSGSDDSNGGGCGGSGGGGGAAASLPAQRRLCQVLCYGASPPSLTHPDASRTHTRPALCSHSTHTLYSKHSHHFSLTRQPPRTHLRRLIQTRNLGRF